MRKYLVYKEGSISPIEVLAHDVEVDSTDGIDSTFYNFLKLDGAGDAITVAVFPFRAIGHVLSEEV